MSAADFSGIYVVRQLAIACTFRSSAQKFRSIAYGRIIFCPAFHLKPCRRTSLARKLWNGPPINPSVPPFPPETVRSDWPSSLAGGSAGLDFQAKILGFVDTRKPARQGGRQTSISGLANLAMTRQPIKGNHTYSRVTWDRDCCVAWGGSGGGLLKGLH